MKETDKTVMVQRFSGRPSRVLKCDIGRMTGSHSDWVALTPRGIIEMHLSSARDDLNEAQEEIKQLEELHKTNAPAPKEAPNE